MKGMDFRLAFLGLLLGLALGGRVVWLWQANSYGQQLAVQVEAFQRASEQAAVAVIDWQEEEQGRRRELEDRLQASDEAHYKELTDEQNDQARLRDRLATAELRLSVLLAGPTTVPSGSSGVREASGSSSVVHGGTRAQLDPAHAQRIVGITSDGDEGLIALKACQAYVRSIAQ
ncbi:lysis protein [Pseudomonas sp. HLS-6]|uniref:lysis system i-spanin subunit Rz n=1 Tax=Pseudomonas sp. HLS-6 TaxID=2049589 RepID=UPI000C177C3D|nr:lysis system i-spanin subunit Rz [Pseudomonas sp. HLS-6]ATR82159.1 lysis protein [Pseudomonas sp. HLS-6]